VGNFSVEKFSYHDVDFEGANFDFAWDGTRAMFARTSACGIAAVSSTPIFSMHRMISG